jgi:GDP-L-fucose synthase
MLRKFHEAKENNNAPVELWGSGPPMREFLHVDDLAQAVLFAVDTVLPDYLYNVGTGTDVTIKDLALTIQNITGHKGELVWDATKPDGTPRKLMDSSKLEKQGWKAKITLEQGVKNTYSWFTAHQENYKRIKL